ncbi:NADPH-dependent F420 reductase [Streptomyces sp. NPDC059096]|uniref:NADPH-dependent F420 reductase n=1 Tax=Streptomyces sp. NPDC059096 TaxID=3346727 RepID=UPI0036BFA957
MKISIIGAGAIGGNLARRLSEAGHDVLAADARGPEVVAADVVAAGVRPVELDQAVSDRDVIVLAIPFSVQPKLAELLTTAPAEAIVVDTSNYYPGMMGPVEAVDNGAVESVWSQERLGRPVVKAWNAALVETQRERALPAGSPGRIAIPVAADSQEQRRTVMTLVDATGFDPFDAGVLAESWRQQPGTPAYCTELGVDDLREALAAADKDARAQTRDRIMAHLMTLDSEPTREEKVAHNRASTR